MNQAGSAEQQAVGSTPLAYKFSCEKRSIAAYGVIATAKRFKFAPLDVQMQEAQGLALPFHAE